MISDSQMEQPEETNYLNLILNNLNGIIYIHDRESRFTFINNKFRDLLGYNSEELIGQPLLSLVPEIDHKRVQDKIWARLEKGEKTSYEINIIYKDKSRHQVRLNASPLIENGRITGGIVLAEDITEQKVFEEATRESQRLMANIIESLPDPTLVIDRGGRVIAWNRAMEEMTGIKAVNMLGKGNHEYALPFYGTRRPILIDLVFKEDEAVDENDYFFIRRDKEVMVVETSIACVKGNTVSLWGHAAPLYDTHGYIVGAIETIRDITDRKKTEEELRQSYENLQNILESTVNALSATAEMRDPYTAGHQRRVVQLACAIAEEMNLPDSQINDIRIAGILHDIGKMYIPTDILSKPGELTDIEFLLVKTHSRAGYDIVKTIPFSAKVAIALLQHHERMNGSGYPQGLTGPDIIPEARILAVSDVVEAMASHRPYRPALGIDKALEEIKLYAGILYDADVVKACLSVFKKGKIQFS